MAQNTKPLAFPAIDTDDLRRQADANTANAAITAAAGVYGGYPDEAGGTMPRSPDVPGCAATGAARKEAEANFRQALRMHLDGLRAEGYPIPKPTASVARVAI